MKTEHKAKHKQSDRFNDFILDVDVAFLSNFLHDLFLDYVVYNKDALPVAFDISVY